MSVIQAQYTDERVRVDEEKGVVTIADFSMSDKQVAEYFASHAPDQREDKMKAAIRAGVLTLKSVDVGERVDYVKKEFELLRTDVEKKMDDAVRGMDGYLGKDGMMPRMMEWYVGKEGEVFKAMERYIGEGGEVSEMAKKLAAEWADNLRQSMDPRDEKSPLHGMRQDILGRLDMMLERIAQRTGEKNIEQKTPLKGREFEEYCLREIGRLAHVTGDTVEDTSKTPGSVPNAKKGDLVLAVAGTGVRIAIELKDVKKISVNEASDVLDGAIENRGADFGLLIVKNREAFPRHMGWFHEFDSTNKLAVALGSESDGNARGWTIHREILLIAYKWARARAMANALDVGRVDAKTIAAKMNDIKGSISSMSGIKRQVTTIEKAASNIRSLADEVTDNVNTALDEVSTSIRKTGAKGAERRPGI